MSDTVQPPAATPPSVWQTIVTRAKEPSTWASISGGAVALASQLPPQYQGYAYALGAAAAAAGVLIGERGKRTPAQLLQDALTAARAVEAQRPVVQADIAVVTPPAKP